MRTFVIISIFLLEVGCTTIPAVSENDRNQRQYEETQARLNSYPGKEQNNPNYQYAKMRSDEANERREKKTYAILDPKGEFVSGMINGFKKELNSCGWNGQEFFLELKCIKSEDDIVSLENRTLSIRIDTKDQRIQSNYKGIVKIQPKSKPPHKILFKMKSSPGRELTISSYETCNPLILMAASACDELVSPKE
ncbi:MAG: hypothetical protein AB7F59_14790 [Bdellovibrionales bacterium]